MRRLSVLLALFLCLTALPGCGEAQGDDIGLRVREKYLQGFEGTAQLSADFGDRLGEYELKFSYVPDGVTSIEVIKPEIISGLTAAISPGETSVSYDGVILETGLLPNAGISPVDALPAMFRTWIDGYLLSEGTERYLETDCYHLTYRTSVGARQLEHQVWFDSATLEPVAAETYADGVMVVRAVFGGKS